MGYTKLQIIEGACAEIGFASYDFDLQPEQLESFRKRLDALMTYLNGCGIRLGYTPSANPDGGDLQTDSNIPDWANEAIITNLALRIAPMLGKTVLQDTKMAAKRGMNLLHQRMASPPPKVKMGDIPRGAGYQFFYSQLPFMGPVVSQVEAGTDTNLFTE